MDCYFGSYSEIYFFVWICFPFLRLTVEYSNSKRSKGVNMPIIYPDLRSYLLILRVITVQGWPLARTVKKTRASLFVVL
jgi:hypothetical protein